MAKFARILLGLALGYAAGVVIGAAWVMAFSGNSHDKSVEMAMTAAFVTGPIGAVTGAVLSGLLKKR